MRIAFIGTCQVHGMADAARHLLPEAEITSFQIGAPYGPAEIINQVRGLDVVISQVADPAVGVPVDQNADVSRAELAKIVKAAIFMPAAVFGGFHPDMMYIHHNNQSLFGFRDDYHSQIIVGSYLNGLDEARTVRLFNAHVFAEFGHLDAYGAAAAAMKAAYSQHGYDIALHVDRWRDEGTVFMHTVNHPAIEVLSQMAAMALARLGLVAPETPAPTGIRDELADSSIAPVLPPIARIIGVAASTTYRQSVVMAQGGPREIPLDEYVRGYFEVYRNCDPAFLQTHGPLYARDRLRDLLS